MPFKKLIAFALGLLTATQVTNVSAAEFTYRSLRYPSQDGGQCGVAAKDLAKRFGEISGHLVLGSGCEIDPVAKFVNLVVRYEADTSVSITSTVLKGVTYVAPGFYNSQALCEEARGRQEELFERHTGLNLLISYCTTNDGQHRSYNSWYVYMDALGTPKETPYWLSFSTLTAFYPSLQTSANEVKTGLESRDVTIANWAWRSGYFNETFNLLVYGSEKYRAGSAQIGSVRGLAECQVARDQLHAQLKQSFSDKYLTSFCAAPADRENPKTFDLTVLYLNSSLEAMFSAEAFGSFKECQANLPRMQEAGESLYGKRLMATSCSHDPYSASSSAVRAVYGVRRDLAGINN